MNDQLQQAAIPKANQLAVTRNLIKILNKAEGEELLDLRRQVRQQLRLLIEKIVVAIKGIPRNPNKEYKVEIFFRNGITRKIFFDTPRRLLCRPRWSSLGGRLEPVLPVC